MFCIRTGTDNLVLHTERYGKTCFEYGKVRKNLFCIRSCTVVHCTWKLYIVHCRIRIIYSRIIQIFIYWFMVSNIYITYKYCSKKFNSTEHNKLISIIFLNTYLIYPHQYFLSNCLKWQLRIFNNFLIYYRGHESNSNENT